MGTVVSVLRGIGRAVKARPKVFAAVALGVFLLDVLLPPVVLSLVRTPMSYFTFNPWLNKLPGYLASSEVSLEKKAEFVPNLALFWFSADGPFGFSDWGFAVTVTDLFRFVFMSLLFGAYFALWFYWREKGGPMGPGARTGGQGGAFGAFVSTLGLSTGPCTVTGCGAPVMPVLGLAFAGLSSGTIALLSEGSKVATWILLAVMTLAVAYLGWVAGQPRR